MNLLGQILGRRRSEPRRVVETVIAPPEYRHPTILPVGQALVQEARDVGVLSDSAAMARCLILDRAGQPLFYYESPLTCGLRGGDRIVIEIPTPMWRLKVKEDAGEIA